MNPKVAVITVDGPSGSGKGTVSLRLAKQLGWHYLDSGALYRVVGYLAHSTNTDLDDAATLAHIAKQMSVRFVDGEIYLDDKAVGDQIRTENAGNRASRVASLPEVRSALLDWQRGCAIPPGLVADGRDMGTVVFPSAACKFFLTASAEARAERRFNQLRLKGFDVTIRQLFEEITERDQRDANRQVSPLKPASDAIVVDTTRLSIEEVVEKILHILKERGLIR